LYIKSGFVATFKTAIAVRNMQKMLMTVKAILTAPSRSISRCAWQV